MSVTKYYHTTKKLIQYSLLVFMLVACTSTPEEKNDTVNIVGAMRNVMWKGELQGSIKLDTISDKSHLYGLGPVAYLAGEILITDGRCYKSTVLTDSTMKVEETFDVEAPFFVYANVDDWHTQMLPDSVQNSNQLEAFLNAITVASLRPFAFKLDGVIESAGIHVVNLPPGTDVRSPGEAHRGQKNYRVENIQSTVIGFFSTAHKAVFTHHDTFIHMHLLTADHTMMGHVDKIKFKPGTMTLYLPK